MSGKQKKPQPGREQLHGKQKKQAPDWERLHALCHQHVVAHPDVCVEMLRVMARFCHPCPFEACHHYTNTTQHLDSHLVSKHKGQEVPEGVCPYEKLLAAVQHMARQAQPTHCAHLPGPCPPALDQPSATDRAPAHPAWSAPLAAAHSSAALPSTGTLTEPPPLIMRAGFQQLGSMLERPLHGQLTSDPSPLEWPRAGRDGIPLLSPSPNDATSWSWQQATLPPSNYAQQTPVLPPAPAPAPPAPSSNPPQFTHVYYYNSAFAPAYGQDQWINPPVAHNNHQHVSTVHSDYPYVQSNGQPPNHFSSDAQWQHGNS